MKRARARLKQDSLDLIARRVLMASYLYYGLNISIIADEVFDAYCKDLHDRWEELDRYKQWQLGSAEEILASGFHVKVTRATIGGAHSWHAHALGCPIPGVVYHQTEPKQSKRHRVDWWTPNQFYFAKEVTNGKRRKAGTEARKKDPKNNGAGEREGNRKEKGRTGGRASSPARKRVRLTGR